MATYCLVVALIFFFQESLLFSPQAIFPSDKINDAQIEALEFRTNDGTTLEALHWKGDTSLPAIVFYHGNAGNNNTWISSLSFLHDAGYPIYCLDYRGYGHSEGSIASEQAFYSDAELFFKLVQKQCKSPIILMGISLGTTPAAYVASRNKTHALILTAPFFSMKRVAKEKYPFVPEFILRYPFETNVYLKNVNCPVALFHGTNDEVFSVTHSQDLHQVLSKTIAIDLFVFNDLGHNDILTSTQFQTKLLKWLSSINSLK